MNASLQAEIDLSALHHNIEVARRHAPNSKLLAVVKAMAYGHGAIPLALHLQGLVDGMAVARVDEARCLRESGISAPLLVLEGPVDKTELSNAARLKVAVVVHQKHQLKLLERHGGNPLECWVKIDTGMHRLGFSPHLASEIFQYLNELPSVSKIKFMTHFATGDDPDSTATPEQVRVFEEAVAGLSAERSLANSAGVLAWPESHADWVRPGLMLYGASPLLGRSAAELGLRPVMTLQAPLIAINRVPAGEAVGYGHTWTTPESMDLGVVGIGYGDGYPRQIDSNAQVLINGRRAKIVGRISMDMLTIDLRGIEANVGDNVILWGEGLPVEDVARWSGTIAYTLLCGVTARVGRRFKA